MSEWKQKNLLDLFDIDSRIRDVQEDKKEANKEFNERIKALEDARNSVLDKIAGGEQRAVFDDEPTDPEIEVDHQPTIELDEDDEPEAPEPGTYLGDDDGEPGSFFE